MPARDGTGPVGEGPATGRGLGPCREEKGVVFQRRSGRGLARGRKFSGFGVRRGLRQDFGRFGQGSVYEENQGNPEIQEKSEEEKKALKEELLEIESEKREIEKRLKELESSNNS